MSIIEAFSARLRSEVDLGVISADLVRVVHETILERPGDQRRCGSAR